MAIKKTAGKTENKGPKPVEVKLVPSNDVSSNRIYANFASVSHTIKYDFSIRFCDVAPFEDVKQVIESGGEHKIPIVAEIAIPSELVPGLINALRAQYKLYEKAIKKPEKKEK
jgi:hypothetical protein